MTTVTESLPDNGPVSNDTGTSDTVVPPTLAPVNVMVGGIPCQPSSYSGRRLGDADSRWLWPDALRIVAELQPQAVLFENVPGLRTLDRGRPFREIIGTLAAVGYDSEWFHLRASDIGAPHERRRLFILAHAQLSERGAVGASTSDMDDSAGELTRSRHHATQPPLPNDAQTYGGGGYPIPDSGTGYAEPWLDRTVNGFSGRLDRCRWPASPGSRQFDWEQPRTAARLPHRVDRLKALGNAVVPQVVYPLALVIRELLGEL